jgi:hypothetical protein
LAYTREWVGVRVDGAVISRWGWLRSRCGVGLIEVRTASYLVAGSDVSIIMTISCSNASRRYEANWRVV